MMRRERTRSRRPIGRKAYSKFQRRTVTPANFEKLYDVLDDFSYLFEGAVKLSKQEEREGMDSPLIQHIPELLVEIDINRMEGYLAQGMEAEDDRDLQDAMHGLWLSTGRILKEDKDTLRELRGYKHLDSVSVFQTAVDELAKFHRRVDRLYGR